MDCYCKEIEQTCHVCFDKTFPNYCPEDSELWQTKSDRAEQNHEERVKLEKELNNVFDSPKL